MATITPKTLVQGMLLAASAPGTPGAYAPGVGITATIRHMRYVNTDSVARTITVHIVASGGSVSAANRILGPVSLDPGDALIDDSIIEMMTGDFISPFASVAGVVAFRADGFEVSP
jgi:hypothetical protein